MSKTIACRDLAALMASKVSYAVFDVRERGEFNASQIANATSLPRSQIEFRIGELVPAPGVPIVVYDEGGDRAALAERTLSELGYSDISVLHGGLSAWQEAGYPTASGVNVPSKAFGERVHRERDIPEITPEELKGLKDSGADLVILDLRTPEEYGRFCIPGGINVPGGDLILWAEELRRKKNTAVVVNCAGRTRSIIGTAALCRLGLMDVRALKNGTMGWVLAGLELESRPTRLAPSAPAASKERATDAALRLAEEERISWITSSELSRVSGNKGSEVTYVVDVRSQAEYEAGHVPGSISVPGGQAVQRADDFVAVRYARIVFISQQSARAVMAAYWYRQMGFRNAQVLRGGLEAWRANGGPVVSGAGKKEPLGLERARSTARMLAAADAGLLLQTAPVVILDVGSSLEYEAAHIRGAGWISRGSLEIKLPGQIPDKSQSILVSCPDGRHSIFGGRTLVELGYKNSFVLGGGVRAWIAAGFPTESGLTHCLTETNDVVLSPSIRGTKEDMQRYLEWELKLAPIRKKERAATGQVASTFRKLSSGL